ncbi:MAG: hypothetical protein V3T14_14090 [Myxococcota bacterium]
MSLVQRANLTVLALLSRVYRHIADDPAPSLVARDTEALLASPWGFYTKYMTGEPGRFRHHALYRLSSWKRLCERAGGERELEGIVADALRDLTRSRFSWGGRGQVRFPFRWRTEAVDPVVGATCVGPGRDGIDPSGLDIHAEIRDAGGSPPRLEGSERLTLQAEFILHRPDELLRICFDVDHRGTDGVNLLPILSMLADRLGLEPMHPTLPVLERQLAHIDREDPLVESTWFPAGQIQKLAGRLGEVLDVDVGEHLLLFLLTYDLNVTASGSFFRHTQNRLRFSAEPLVRLRLQRGDRLGLYDLLRMASGEVPRGLRLRVARHGFGPGAARDAARAAVLGLIERFGGTSDQLRMVADGLLLPTPLRDGLEWVPWTVLLAGNVHLSGQFVSSIVPHRISKKWFPDFETPGPEWWTDFGGHHVAGPALSERALQIAASSCSRVKLEDGSEVWVVQTKVNGALAPRSARSSGPRQAERDPG